MWALYPGRNKFRPEGEDHQHPQRGHQVDEEVEGLARGGVAPVHVLPHHQHGLPRCQSLDLRQLSVKRLLLALLRGEIERRGTVYEMEKGHTYWIGEFAGNFFSNKGKGSLLDQTEVKCFGFNDADTNNTRNKQGGYCVWTDADGDHAYSVWEANDTLG